VIDYKKVKRVSVFGCTGSGKSYIAGELSDIFGLPIIYFDHYTWNPDRTKVDKGLFVKNIMGIMEDRWITDGNHSRDDELTKRRFVESDLIVFLDFQVEDCIEAIKQRQGVKRKDIPDYLLEDYKDTQWLINHAKNWKADGKPDIIKSQIQKYKTEDKVVVLKDRIEVRNFLSGIKNSLDKEACKFEKQN